MYYLGEPMVAICHRCGEEKSNFSLVCARCGHRPVDDGLLVAWLLSTNHLSAEELPMIAQRIRDGKTIRPSEKQLRVARRALGRSFASDPGLSGNQRLVMLGLSFVATPLPAWVCFFWWITTRPRAAWQSFSVALPATLVFTAIGFVSFAS